jgi:hypothetical protein
MPEFEDNKPNPDIHKNAHNYQPSKTKQDQGSDKENAPTTPSSNMRGRWKRPTRGGVSKPAPKDEKPIDHPSPNRSITEKEETFSDRDHYETEEYEPLEEKKEYFPKPHSSRKPREDHREPRKEEKTFKPASRKDVFIPKTKQDSERHRTRLSSTHKKPSLWRKILAFLGLAAPIKKASEHKPHARHSNSDRRSRSSSQHKKPYQKRHSGPPKHRSGSTYKNDQKSND